MQISWWPFLAHLALVAVTIVSRWIWCISKSLYQFWFLKHPILVHKFSRTENQNFTLSHDLQPSWIPHQRSLLNPLIQSPVCRWLLPRSLRATVWSSLARRPASDHVRIRHSNLHGFVFRWSAYEYRCHFILFSNPQWSHLPARLRSIMIWEAFPTTLRSLQTLLLFEIATTFEFSRVIFCIITEIWNILRASLIFTYFYIIVLLWPPL